MPLEPAETRPRSMQFPESRVTFSRYNQQAKHRRLAGTEYFGETAVQPRDHIPCQHHAETTESHFRARRWYDYPQPRIIFSRLTQAKYHRITHHLRTLWEDVRTIFFKFYWKKFPENVQIVAHMFAKLIITCQSRDFGQSARRLTISKPHKKIK